MPAFYQWDLFSGPLPCQLFYKWYLSFLYRPRYEWHLFSLCHATHSMNKTCSLLDSIYISHAIADLSDLFSGLRADLLTFSCQHSMIGTCSLSPMPSILRMVLVSISQPLYCLYISHTSHCMNRTSSLSLPHTSQSMNGTYSLPLPHASHCMNGTYSLSLPHASQSMNGTCSLSRPISASL